VLICIAFKKQVYPSSFYRGSLKELLNEAILFQFQSTFLLYVLYNYPSVWENTVWLDWSLHRQGDGWWYFVWNSALF